MLALLVALTAGAWALTVHQARTMDMPMGIVLRGMEAPEPVADSGDSMAGMDMGSSATDGVMAVASTGMSGMEMNGWTWDQFSTFLVAWAVMMAAMMFPAVAPLLLLYQRMAGRSGSGKYAPTWVLAAGYLLVWTLAGAITWALVQVGIEVGKRLGAGDRETWAPLALGVTLVVAGLYQFTPLKRSCLRQCQTPVGFLMTHWHAGNRGAIRMGVEHGLYCLGCCWALFAVLVAAGVMSLAWMLLLTVIVFVEKVIRTGVWGPRLVGAGFAVMGLLVAAGAISMPWRA